MDETYRMLGKEHEADLERDALKWRRAAEVRGSPRDPPSAPGVERPRKAELSGPGCVPEARGSRSRVRRSLNLMRRLVLLVPTATVVFALASTAAALRPLAATHQTPKPSPPLNLAPRIELKPGVVGLRERATITVSGIRTRSLQVLLAGATDPPGRQPATQLPWRSLRLLDGAWFGTLPAPALRGVYPVVLRTGAGAAPLRSPRLFLRVFAAGTGARPSFDNPVDVVRWWVRTVPHARLVAFKAWPRPGFDRRDVRLHRLFVVAYSPPGHPLVTERLGMFVTAFRDGYRGNWRLLEATLQP
jgi:hypothetical protein